MKNFGKIKFQGTFRNYQQRVLDNSKKYLKNNKIHIVAAPGSGKTILGLELIRRLDSPCIVLSPTNTIRYQWGDRFESMYLPEGHNINDYISYDLNDVKLITSITYQGLHSSINKIACNDEEGNPIDYSQIDLFKLINEFGIKTICVDEAHHLQNEWQKALETFMKGLSPNIKVIALTATPPYDASPTEWNRYIQVCGEIDEEIFVTELVKAKNLCPHQDYVYLSYPTKEESILIKKHKQNILKCFEELKTLIMFDAIPDKIFDIHKSNTKTILSNIQDYTAIFGLLKKLGKEFNEKKAYKSVRTRNFLTDNTTCETALNFLLTDPNLLIPECKNMLTAILKKYGLIERSKVSIDNNEKIEKNLLKSMGKMESITKIVTCEHTTLQDNLRLLILTDFIRKKELTKVGTNEIFNELSIVSIFETIRRINSNIKIAALSGTLVILPNELEPEVRTLLGENANKLTTRPLLETGYSEFEFSLSNKEKVAIIGQLFEQGKILAIVGTKSLLGEGWDSPCINTLIMASFVGSFMLSNQMRGRAIRTFKLDENKTANIWHLVTLEPEEETSGSLPQTITTETKDNIEKANNDNPNNSNTNEVKAETNNTPETANKSTETVECNEETSADYKTLKRRFNCFVGPHYVEKKIESGIDRISILKPSYTKDTVNTVNSQMEELAKNRQDLAEKWQAGNKSGIMYMQSSIPKELSPKGLGIFTIFIPTLIFAILSICTLFVIPNTINSKFLIFISYVASVGLLVLFLFSLIRTITLCIPKLFIRHIAKRIMTSLEQEGHISNDGKIKIKTNKTKNTIDIVAVLDNIKEQKVLLDTIQEFFSPIIDPRYVIIKTFFGIKIHRYSFQVPTLLSANKETVDPFVKQLKLLLPFKLVFAKSIGQTRTIINCQKRSYIKVNGKQISQKQVC